MKQTSFKKNSKLTKTALFVFKSSNQQTISYGNQPTDPTGDPTSVTITMTSGINLR